VRRPAYPSLTSRAAAEHAQPERPIRGSSHGPVSRSRPASRRPLSVKLNAFGRKLRAPREEVTLYPATVVAAGRPRTRRSPEGPPSSTGCGAFPRAAGRDSAPIAVVLCGDEGPPPSPWSHTETLARPPSSPPSSPSPRDAAAARVLHPSIPVRPLPTAARPRVRSDVRAAPVGNREGRGRHYARRRPGSQPLPVDPGDKGAMSSFPAVRPDWPPVTRPAAQGERRVKASRARDHQACRREPAGEATPRATRCTRFAATAARQVTGGSHVRNAFVFLLVGRSPTAFSRSILQPHDPPVLGNSAGVRRGLHRS